MADPKIGYYVGIAAFILSLVFFIPFAPAIGVIFGIVALVKLSKVSDKRGQGFAIAGIIIGLLFTLLHILFTVLFVMGMSILGAGFEALETADPAEALENCVDEDNPAAQDFCAFFVISLNPVYEFEDGVCDTYLSDGDLKNSCKAAVFADGSFCQGIVDTERRSKCQELANARKQLAAVS